MARSSRRDDEDALDPVEAADVDAEDPDEADGFSETEDDEDFEEDDLESDELDEDDEAIAASDPAEVGDDLLEDDVAPVEVALPEGTGFDDDEVIAAVAVDDEDLEDEDVDGLREGEFVCRSCHMAKRDTQLADPERLLCRDCA